MLEDRANLLHKQQKLNQFEWVMQVVSRDRKAKNEYRLQQKLSFFVNIVVL